MKEMRTGLVLKCIYFKVKICWSIGCVILDKGKRQGNSKDIDLSYWKDGVAIYWDGEDCGESKSGEGMGRFLFERVNWKMDKLTLSGFQMEMSRKQLEIWFWMLGKRSRLERSGPELRAVEVFGFKRRSRLPSTAYAEITGQSCKVKFNLLFYWKRACCVI